MFNFTLFYTIELIKIKAFLYHGKTSGTYMKKT